MGNINIIKLLRSHVIRLIKPPGSMVTPPTGVGNFAPPEKNFAGGDGNFILDGSIGGTGPQPLVATSSTSGTITKALATGGTQPYAWTYSVNTSPVTNGSTNTFDYSTIPRQVTAQTYTITYTVTDAQNKTAQTTQTFVVQASGNPLTASSTVSGTIVTASASGGTTPYSFTYSVNTVPVRTGSTNTFDESSVPAQTNTITYTVTFTVTDAVSNTAQTAKSFTVQGTGGGGGGKKPIIGWFCPQGTSPWIPLMQSHNMSAPDFGASFSVSNLNSYPAAMEQHILFYSYTNADANSIAAAITNAQANSFAVCSYDNEISNGGFSTPSVEWQGYQDPPTNSLSLNSYYTNLSADKVHAATGNLRFEVCPGFPMVNGTNGATAMKGTNWLKADSWNVQQESQPSVAQILTNITNYIVPAKTANPNMKVYIEVNPVAQGFTATDIANIWNNAKQHIDGFQFVVHTGDSSSLIDSILTALGR